MMKAMTRPISLALGVGLGGWASSAALAIGVLHPYGAGQCLTPQQVTRVTHLAWPQSGQAMRGLLGSPEYYNRWEDWYCLPNTAQSMIVEFDWRGRAIGLRWGG